MACRYRRTVVEHGPEKDHHRIDPYRVCNRRRSARCGARRGAPVAVTADAVAFDEHPLAGSRLEFLGAVTLASTDPAFGAFTGLRWQEDERRFYAVTRHGAWFELPTIERDLRLTGIGAVRGGYLLDLQGKPATGLDADAEAIDTAGANGWIVLIGARRLLPRYPHLDAKPLRAQMHAREARGGPFLNGSTPDVFDYETSGGVSFDALGQLTSAEYPTAFEGSGSYFICARRGAQPRANCASIGADGPTPYSVGTTMQDSTAVPTDMDDVVLLQSPGPADRRATVIRSDRPEKILAVFTPPGGAALEGVAMRTMGNRSYLYMISDSSRSSGGETVLLKFELLPSGKR